jgi:hypothetical protein
MKEINFDGSGSSLSVNIRYESNHGANLFATYTYTLWEHNSGSIADKSSGNNFNTEDDNYWLPTPALKNNGRVIDVLSILKNAGAEALNAKVEIEVCQGGVSLDKVHEIESVMGDSTVTAQIFIRLKAS